jgi:hypothetical protein
VLPFSGDAAGVVVVSQLTTRNPKGSRGPRTDSRFAALFGC